MLQVNEIIKQKYQLKELLGKRPARQTWLAQDLQATNKDNNYVVIKFLAFGGQVQWEDLKLFEREAQVLQELNHFQIPKYCDYFSIDENILWFCLVEQYIPGNSLQKLLQDGKRFSETEVKNIAQQLLNIVIYLHNLHPYVLHRDIKPSNIILDKNRQIYLVDFGAVQDKAATEGASFTVVGTYGYTPMEQFGGRAIPQSDLYALGATLIHLLTGIAPVDLPQKNLKIQFKSKVNVSRNFGLWLSKIIEPSIENRFASAKDSLNTLLEEKILLNKATINLRPKNTSIQTSYVNNEYQISLSRLNLYSKLINIILQFFKLSLLILILALFPFLLIISLLIAGSSAFVARIIPEWLLLLLFLIVIVIIIGAIASFIVAESKSHRQIKNIKFLDYDDRKIKLFFIHTIFGSNYCSRTALIEKNKFTQLADLINKSDKSKNNRKLFLKTENKDFQIARNLTQEECNWLMAEFNQWLERES